MIIYCKFKHITINFFFIEVLEYTFDLSPKIYMVLLMIILDYFARPQNATWSHNKNKV